MSVITLNPDDKSSRIDLSNSNMTATSNSSSFGMARATSGKTSGKWYWEIYCDDIIAGSTTNKRAVLGSCTSSGNLDNYLGSDAHGWGYFSGNAQKYNGGSGSTYGDTYDTYGTGNFIGVALDIDNGTIEFFLNGGNLGVAFTSIPTDGTSVFAGVSMAISGAQVTANFGQQEFHIRKGNSPEWNRLLNDGFQSYDSENANLLNEETSSYIAISPTNKNTRIKLSNNNLTARTESPNWHKAMVTSGKTSGKWYWEIYCDDIIADSGTGKRSILGTVTDLAPTSGGIGADAYGWGYSSWQGRKYHDNSNSLYGEPYGTGNTIGMALNIDDGTIGFFYNGANQGEAYSNIPTDGTEMLSAISMVVNGASVTVNLGQNEFDIATSNPTAWTNLLSQGYQPYDSNNALWLPRMLILCDGDLLYWNSTQWNVIDYADINSLTKEDVENYAFMPGILDNTKIQELPNDIFKPYLFRLS